MYFSEQIELIKNFLINLYNKFKTSYELITKFLKAKKVANTDIVKLDDNVDENN